MSLDEVIRRLFDGLDKGQSDWEIARKRLPELMRERNLTTDELDDLCFEDSTKVFDYIYE